MPSGIPFQFQRLRGAVDQAKLRSLTLDRLIRTNDLEPLNELVPGLAYGNLRGYLESHDAPPWAVKLMQVQQYLQQYLLYTVDDLQQGLSQAALSSTDAEEAALRAEIQALHLQLREAHRERQTNNTLLRFISVRPESLEALPRCLVCGKAFGDYGFLLQHYSRRHPDAQIPPPPVPAFPAPCPPCECCNHLCHQRRTSSPTPRGTGSVEPVPATASLRSVSVGTAPSSTTTESFTAQDTFSIPAHLQRTALPEPDLRYYLHHPPPYDSLSLDVGMSFEEDQRAAALARVRAQYSLPDDSTLDSTI